MLKRWAVILTVLALALWLGGVVLAALVQARPASTSAGMVRDAAPRVLFGQQNSRVSLNHIIPTRAECAARPDAWVVLVLDRSSSMAEGSALAEATAAARQFVNLVDLTKVQLAIIFFADQAFTGASFSQERSVLLASLQGVVPAGGTNLNVGLQAVARLFGAIPGAGDSQRAVILLTDGLTNDTEGVLDTTRQLAAGGVRMIAVGLGQADVGFLSQLVGQPQDFYVAPTPNDLYAVYRSLATEISPAIATQVALTESLNPTFTVLTQTVTPTVIFRGNDLLWRTETLTNGEVSLAYTVTPRALGLHPVNQEATMLTFVDCLNQPVVLVLSPGPTLLALPSTPVLALLAALTLLAPPGLLLFGSRRAGKQGEQARPPSPDRVSDTDIGTPAPDPTPAWITRLDEKKILTLDREYQATGDLAPTVIIGIGEIGRFVLSQVAQLLRSRYGPTLPNNVRLLQIDVIDRGAGQPLPERPAFLDPAEWVLLTPYLTRFGENVQRNPQDWVHLNWYNGAQPDFERARGRLALFDDLKNGADDSSVWQRLSQVLQGLTSPKLRVVGSTFDDVSSGSLIDITRLLQIARGSSQDVELWLAGPLGEDWSDRLHDPRRKVRASEQTARTLATLRELERFQRNARIPFHFVPRANVQDQFYGEVNAAVVQTLFLFEKSDPKMSVADHLTSIADALLATLHVSARQELDRLLTTHRAAAFDIVNSDQIGMACTLVTYAVRMPGGPLQRAVAWRMLYELLFEQRVGLLPQVGLNENGTYTDMDPEELLRRGPEEQAAEQAEISAFVRSNRRRLLTPEFRAVVAHRVSALMNGERMGAALPQVARVGGLLRAERWVRALKNELRLVEPEAVAAVERLRQQLEEWREFLTETVQPVVWQQLVQSQQAITDLGSQTGRIWVAPAQGEWSLYKETIRPWTIGEPDINAAGEPLLRAAQRFGWQIAFDESGRHCQVSLIAPPPDYVWQGEATDVGRYILPQEPAPLVQALHRYVRALATNERANRYVLQLAREKLPPGEWVSRVVPKLRPEGDLIDDAEASRLMKGAVDAELFLVAPQDDLAGQLRTALEGARGAPSKVKLCSTADPSAVTLLFVRSRVPLITYNLYSQTVWRDELPLPGLYVWRGEQIAADMERGAGQRLGLEFVSWLERDAQLLDLFAQAYVLDLVELGSLQADVPGVGKVQGGRVGQLLAALLGEDSQPLPDTLRRSGDKERALRALTDAVAREKKRYQQSPGMEAYLIWARENLIEPLRQVEGERGYALRERNFTIYLDALARRWESES